MKKNNNKKGVSVAFYGVSGTFKGIAADFRRLLVFLGVTSYFRSSKSVPGDFREFQRQSRGIPGIQKSSRDFQGVLGAFQ